jgi:hypothetical protein
VTPATGVAGRILGPNDLFKSLKTHMIKLYCFITALFFIFGAMDLIKNWSNNLSANWQDALSDKGFRKYFPPNFLGCFAVHYSVVFWLKMNSNHPGMVLNDPMYGFFAPRDLSSIIFFFTYTATILTVLYVVQYPYLFQRGCVAFVAVFLVRAIFIHLIPLSPAPGIIPLQDPVTNWLADEGRIMNDLFFSGHVADLTMFGLLCSHNARLRSYIFLCAAVVAVLLVWQRVHYTVDVVMAPAFSYVSYWLFVEKDIIWGHFLKKQGYARNQDHFSVR